MYAPYIDTPITFEEKVPSLDEFEARVSSLLTEYPYLVAEQGNTIVGYAYAHAQADRAAYDWNAELSVYLSPLAQGTGLGSLLYETELELLEAQGVKCAYARVTIPNAASERLHASFSFELMGIQRNAGYTCGAWRDVAWYTRTLDTFEADPKPRVAFSSLDASVISDIIERANHALATRFEQTATPNPSR